MIMRNHGLLSVGRTVAEAFYFLYTVENACKVQLDVLATGKEIVTPRPDIIEQMARKGVPPAERPDLHAEMAWKAVMRQLDQKDPSYRD
jgi:ribulose-5-phosphate 4-epimerase/fuculose-1-phosphate aldolase